MPESSANAGRPLARLTWRALASAFSIKVQCGSSASEMPSCACVSTSIPSGASMCWNSRSLPGLLEAMTSFCTALFRQCGTLFFDQLRDTVLCQFQQRIHLRTREGMTFRRALHFDKVAVAQHHHVHVGVAGGVFDIVEVEHGRAFIDADGNCRNEILERRFLDEAFAHQTAHRIMQRDESASDAGGAGAAVGLDHVAIDLDGALAQLAEVDHG